MATPNFEEYAVLDAKIKELTEKKEKIRASIVDELYNSGMHTAKTAVGNFTIALLKTWKYTEAVDDKTEELKALKAKEESTGDASYEEKPSLRFSPVKF